jgi:hypothetical protein
VVLSLSKGWCVALIVKLEGWLNPIVLRGGVEGSKRKKRQRGLERYINTLDLANLVPFLTLLNSALLV